MPHDLAGGLEVDQVLSVSSFGKTVLSRFIIWLEEQPKGLLLLLSLLLAILLGILDFLTGYEVAFSIFYLIPISLVSRRDLRSQSVLVCLLCAALWLIADMAGGHPYSNRFIPYWNGFVRLMFFLIVSFSFSEVRASFQALRAMALTDPLTGTANLRGFRLRALTEIERYSIEGHPLTVAYFDLDDFKSVNDTFGHATGDALLVRVAEVTTLNIRKTDLLARVGGDEFAIVLSSTGAEGAQKVVERIRENLYHEMSAHDWPVTLSIGVATFLSPPSSVDEIMHQVDDLMYQAKRLGKNALICSTYAARDGEAATMGPSAKESG